MVNAKYYRFLEIKDDMLLKYFKEFLPNDDRFHILRYDELIAKALHTENSEAELDKSVFMRVDGGFFTIIDTGQVGKVKDNSWRREFGIKKQFSADDLKNDNLRTRGYIVSSKGRLHEIIKGKEKGNDIHHIKHTFDNRRSNLEPMKHEEHMSFHNSGDRKYWWDRGTLCVKYELSLQELIDYL